MKHPTKDTVVFEDITNPYVPHVVPVFGDLCDGQSWPEHDELATLDEGGGTWVWKSQQPEETGMPNCAFYQLAFRYVHGRYMGLCLHHVP